MAYTYRCMYLPKCLTKRVMQPPVRMHIRQRCLHTKSDYVDSNTQYITLHECSCTFLKGSFQRWMGRVFPAYTTHVAYWIDAKILNQCWYRMEHFDSEAFKHKFHQIYSGIPTSTSLLSTILFVKKLFFPLNSKASGVIMFHNIRQF